MNCFCIHKHLNVSKSTKTVSSQNLGNIFSDPDTTMLSGTHTSNMSCGSSRKSSKSPTLVQSPNNLMVFTLSELRNATKNFSRSLVVGEGGFGCVYKGIIRNPDNPNTKLQIAVKQLNRKGWQGNKAWLNEVHILGTLDHPNLVKLIGYCVEDDQRGVQKLLVYEFMPNGSVQDHLSSHHPVPLSWIGRLKVTRDVAQGLTYLHEEVVPTIIFRDLKTSNILLDDQWNGRLSDFGLAREGPGEGLSHVTTLAVGTIGYVAPEYIHTGQLTVWSDVWSYGVVLYELITGRSPWDNNRPKNEQKLLQWVKPYIADGKKIHMIIDPRLEGQYSLKSVQKLVAVANKCLVRNPKSRPKMSYVLNLIHQIIDSVETGGPQSSPFKMSMLGEENDVDSKEEV